MSKENNCYWSADGSHLPNVHAHTKVKHRVLENYVQNWIETLTGHGAHGAKTVTLIDGFCGGGMYKDADGLWEGSSIRMLQKVQEGLDNVRLRKPWHELDAEFIFIDNKKAHTKCLELQLKDAGFEHLLVNGKCKILTGRFEKHLEYCLNRVKERGGYSFFFLDPFGLDISPSIVREILRLGRSEVLFNHMLSGLVRILKRREDRYKNFFEDFEADEYYRDIADQDDFRLKQAYLRNEALNIFRTEGEAKFAHTFALMSNPKSVLYYLIHLSGNPTALSVMRNTTWLQNNLEYQFHYGVYGLGYRTLDDIANNLTIYNIEEQNVRLCVDRLANQLMEFITEEGDTAFNKLYCSTIQENPATKQLYFQAINLLQDEGDLIAFREGKHTDSRRIENKDIIKRARFKQTFLLDNQYKQKSAKQKKSRVNSQKSEKVIVIPDQEQLKLLDL
ncbi:three-Cys-motif partner protein TcmP [Trichocoleus sp. FACHB-591]|uniref:three-Cys-motif partner protein TcmP n=1 Tax=Trichocoleus sp. FACHB-591 TaxID=2692872 RepID=UPI00168324D8|nr:three-Cys-motif partner protein TcmP [Trichocoleus sp. FACHB-591]MBD2098476.1 three-Cys-motif partner protein TcmP [Trichocoleus sp. FACHB-591]